MTISHRIRRAASMCWLAGFRNIRREDRVGQCASEQGIHVDVPQVECRELTGRSANLGTWQ